MFDDDGNGDLTIDEIIIALNHDKHMTNTDLKQIILEVNENGDGNASLTFEQFEKLVTSNS